MLTKSQTVSIAPGNSKLGAAIPNVSLRPGADCGNCKHCIKTCYAVKAFRMYRETKAAWTRNGKLFRKDPIAACEQIHDHLARKRTRPEFFRIHVSGDFLNQQHVDAWSAMVARNPDIKFLAFTKMHELDYSGAPENMAVVFSQWPGLADAAPAGKPRAWVQDGTETRIPADALHCPGSCATCAACWGLASRGIDVWFSVH